MYGDIIYVDREPLLWRSTRERENANSKKLDLAIYRMTKYRHFGIDIGDDLVAHFQADSFWERDISTIIISTMNEFVKDGILSVDYMVEMKYDREEIVERAISCVDTNFGGYSILSNNCEHFALWCATGNKEARQYGAIRYGFKFASKPIRPISEFVFGYLR